MRINRDRSQSVCTECTKLSIAPRQTGQDSKVRAKLVRVWESKVLQRVYGAEPWCDAKRPPPVPVIGSRQFLRLSSWSSACAPGYHNVCDPTAGSLRQRKRQKQRQKPVMDGWLLE